MEEKSIKTILIVIGIGIWMLVLQNAGIIPKIIGAKNGTQTVYVKGGYIDVDNTVRVRGSVDVDNTVDINIEAVNGHSNAFYGPSNNGNYDALHVYTGR